MTGEWPGKHSPENIFIEKKPEVTATAADERLFGLSWKFALAGVLALLAIPVSLPIIESQSSGWDALGYFIVVLITAGVLSLILFTVAFVTGLKIVKSRRVALWWLVPIGIVLVAALLYVAALAVAPYVNF